MAWMRACMVYPARGSAGITAPNWVLHPGLWSRRQESKGHRQAAQMLKFGFFRFAVAPKVAPVIGRTSASEVLHCIDRPADSRLSMSLLTRIELNFATALARSCSPCRERLDKHHTS
jgi:hypothetical protein